MAGKKRGAAARDRLGRALFAKWNPRDVRELVRLMQKFAQGIRGEEVPGRLHRRPDPFK